MARDGERANLPYDPEIEAALAKLEGMRVSKIEFEFDGEARIAYAVLVPERVTFELEPPKPVRVGIPFCTLKTATGQVLAFEGEQQFRRGAAGDKPEMAAAGVSRRNLGMKLCQEGEEERRGLVVRREAQKAAEGMGKPLDGPGGAPGGSTGAPGAPIPGIDV